MVSGRYFRIRNGGCLTSGERWFWSHVTFFQAITVEHGWGGGNHYSSICFFKNEEQVCLFCRDVLFQVSSNPEGFTIDECATCLRRNGPFRIQPSQLDGHSAPCLFMLTCLLFSLLLLLFLAPILIRLSVSCMSHRSVCSGSLNGPIVWHLR